MRTSWKGIIGGTRRLVPILIPRNTRFDNPVLEYYLSLVNTENLFSKMLSFISPETPLFGWKTEPI
jgi:hypothetical protein